MTHHKPKPVFKVVPPIVAFFAGLFYVVIRSWFVPGGATAPFHWLDLGFLITTGVIVIGFPFISRCWFASLLSPLLYFGAIFLSTQAFYVFTGMAPLGALGLFAPTTDTYLFIYIGWGVSSLYGLLVGFVIYSVFNLTSYAIFNWPLSTAIVDTIMGTINCGIAASLIYWIYFVNH